jgi:hypothetical protein
MGTSAAKSAQNAVDGPQNGTSAAMGGERQVAVCRNKVENLFE